jgi:hypothetical protein
VSARSLYDLKVGDRVQVFESFRRQPQGGLDATVVKVGRKLITVKYGHCESVFRLENGRINNDYGHSWIRTVEQAAEDLRRKELVQRLRDGGVDLRVGTQFAMETLEALVNVVDQAKAGVSVGEGQTDA